MRLLILPILAVLAVCAATGLSAAEKVALVVGNNAYQHAGRLENPVRDARAVAGVLKGLGFEVISVEDATVERFYDGLEKLKAKAAGARLGLVYFAGHGVEIGGKNYLLPVDAELSSAAQLRTQAVALDAVLVDLEATGIPAKLAILDCCRNDPLSRGWMATRSAGSGLAELKDGQLPNATMVMFSAGPGQVAADGDGRNSPFTDALVKRLGVRGQSVFDAFLGTSDDVVKATGRKQEPWVKFDGAGRTFREMIIAGNAPGEPLPAAVDYVLAPASRIHFVGSKITGSHKGTFKISGGSFTLVNGELGEGENKVLIDLGSIATDNERLTAHLKSPDFFDLETYPDSSFKITALAREEADTYKVTGDFTLKGVTKTLSFPATVRQSAKAAAIQASFKIKRKEFGILYAGKVDDLIRDEVAMELKLDASPK